MMCVNSLKSLKNGRSKMQKCTFEDIAYTYVKSNLNPQLGVRGVFYLHICALLVSAWGKVMYADKARAR